MKMNKYIKPEKRCENCRYYSNHFSKQGTRIDNVHCGHCLHKKIRNYKRQPLELCENWETIEIQKEERKRDIEEAIIAISERLDEIALILKDDMEN